MVISIDVNHVTARSNGQRKKRVVGSARSSAQHLGQSAGIGPPLSSSSCSCSTVVQAYNQPIPGVEELAGVQRTKWVVAVRQRSLNNGAAFLRAIPDDEVEGSSARPSWTAWQPCQRDPASTASVSFAIILCTSLRRIAAIITLSFTLSFHVDFMPITECIPLPTVANLRFVP